MEENKIKLEDLTWRTFESEADRATYLPHPDHMAFVALLDGHVDDVLVLDYWSK